MLAKDWLSLISQIQRKTALFLFMDLSVLSLSFNTDSMESLIDIAVTFIPNPKHQLVASVPSGVAHMLPTSNAILHSRWNQVYSCCSRIDVTGFTSDEAKQYLALCGSTLSFVEVYPLTGTNPLLLRHAVFQHGIGDLKVTLNGIAKNFLVQNCSISNDKNYSTLKDCLFKE